MVDVVNGLKRLFTGRDRGVPRSASATTALQNYREMAGLSMNNYTFEKLSGPDEIEYGIRSRTLEGLGNYLLAVVPWTPTIARATGLLGRYTISAVTGFQGGESITEVTDVDNLVQGVDALAASFIDVLVAGRVWRQRREWRKGYDAYTAAHAVNAIPTTQPTP